MSKIYQPVFVSLNYSFYNNSSIIFSGKLAKSSGSKPRAIAYLKNGEGYSWI